MTLIATQDELAAFCGALENADFITVDTEFMRERTYYAKLCLIQIGGPQTAAAIDPLAENIDLAPLFALFDNPKILKVFHAARQDVEIFVSMTGRVPAPLFDTQVAAMVCGFGEAASYETLASRLAGAKIDKTSRFTDWARRPLTKAQTSYALADVTHLRKVYEKLAAKLDKTGRGDWVKEEMAFLSDKATYSVDPFEIWKRIKLRTGKPRARAVLRELAAWREKEAQRANLPRGRILKDEQLAEIASHAPQTAEELSSMRGLSKGFAQGKHGSAVLKAVARGLACPPEECPSLEPRKAMPNGAGAVLDLLRVLLHQVSEAHDVAAKLIATNEDLARLASEDEPDIKPLSGWRGGLFGQAALALKSGEIALAVKDKKIETIRIKG